MAEHPRIGDRVSGRRPLSSPVSPTTPGPAGAGNVEYEERFGHVFLICATGLSGEDMLAALRERLSNDPCAERAVATAELLTITTLRARKLAGA